MSCYGGVKNTYEELDDNCNKQIITLGDHCIASLYLKKCGLKSCSYPFDWIVTNLDMIVDILENDFDRFMNQTDYYDSFFKGQIFYQHRSLDKDREYFERCINRFKNLNSNDINIYFMIISHLGGDNITKMKEIHRDYTLEDYKKIYSLLPNPTKLVIVHLEKDKNNNFTTFDNIDIYTKKVEKLQAAILDNSTEKWLIDLYKHYFKN
jgi:hypothetical protein